MAYSDYEDNTDDTQDQGSGDQGSYQVASNDDTGDGDVTGAISSGNQDSGDSGGSYQVADNQYQPAPPQQTPDEQPQGQYQYTPSDIMKMYGPVAQDQSTNDSGGNDQPDANVTPDDVLKKYGSLAPAGQQQAQAQDPNNPDGEKTSWWGALGREAMRDVAPITAGTIAAAATAPTLTPLGGLGVGAGVGLGVGKLQDELADKLGLSDPHRLLGGEDFGLNAWNKNLQDLDAAQHPHMQALGAVAAAIGALKNGNAAPIVRLVSGAAFGAVEALSQYIQKGNVDWYGVAGGAALGAWKPGAIGMNAPDVKPGIRNAFNYLFDTHQVSAERMSPTEMAEAAAQRSVDRSTGQTDSRGVSTSPAQPLGADGTPVPGVGNGAQAPMAPGTGRDQYAVGRTPTESENPGAGMPSSPLVTTDPTRPIDPAVSSVLESENPGAGMPSQAPQVKPQTPPPTPGETGFGQAPKPPLEQPPATAGQGPKPAAPMTAPRPAPTGEAFAPEVDAGGAAERATTDDTGAGFGPAEAQGERPITHKDLAPSPTGYAPPDDENQSTAIAARAAARQAVPHDYTTTPAPTALDPDREVLHDAIAGGAQRESTAMATGQIPASAETKGFVHDPGTDSWVPHESNVHLDEGTQPMSPSMLKNFLGDETGALNTQKVVQSFKDNADKIYTGLGRTMERVFGTPFTDIGRQSDQALVAGKAWKQAQYQRYVNGTNGIAQTLDAAGHVWNKELTDADNQKIMFAFQAADRTGVGLKATILPAKFESALLQEGLDPAKAKWVAQLGDGIKKLYDQFYTDEAKLGSNARYKEGYLQGVFNNGPEFNNWLQARKVQLGPTAFQKEKVYDTIKAAMNDGFKLRYPNMMDQLSHRAMASADMQSIIHSMAALRRLNVAFKEGDAQAPQGYLRWKQYVDPVGNKWRVNPDADPLFNNILASKGLWENQGMPGNIYRGLMQVKAAWMPYKLGFSGFHYLHLAGVGAVQPVVRGMYNDTVASKAAGVAKGLLQAPKDASDILALPISRIPVVGPALDKLYGGSLLQNPGRVMRNVMLEPAGVARSQLSLPQFKDLGLGGNAATDADLQKILVQGGQIVGRNPQEYIGNAKAALQRAWAEGNYGKMILPGIAQGIRATSSAFFEDAIPAIKISNYLKDAQAFARNQPAVWNDPVKRAIALRTLGKQADDRFGEMFYDGLGWNKILKDIGQFSSVSLGWNAGYGRQLFGAGGDLAQKTLDRMGIRPLDDLQKVRLMASNRGSYMTAYTAAGMMTMGGMSWALTGHPPDQLLDYFYPRDGYKNPDGSDHRMTSMWNTRDIFAAKYHGQESGSILGGVRKMLTDKFITGPLLELLNNRDFFGNEMYDASSPYWKMLLQGGDSLARETLKPASVEGAQRALQQGTGWGGAARAALGFGPAPKYLYNTPIENRINQLYYDGQKTRPYAKGGGGLFQDIYNSAAPKLGLQGNQSNDELKHQAQQDLQNALQNKDPRAIQDAAHRMRQYGASDRAVKGAEDPKGLMQYRFRQLDVEYQKQLVQQMTPEEFNFYVKKGQVSVNTFKELEKYYRSINQ